MKYDLFEVTEICEDITNSKLYDKLPIEDL